MLRQPVQDAPASLYRLAGARVKWPLFARLSRFSLDYTLFALAPINDLVADGVATLDKTGLRLVLIKLDLNKQSAPPEPGSETEPAAPPAESVISIEEAIRSLQQLQQQPSEAAPQPRESAIEQSFPEQLYAEESVPEEPGEAVLYWLNRYSRSPAEAIRQIRRLSARAPERVVETVLPLYQSGSLGEASRFIASLLSSDHCTAAKLCDPSASLEGSVNLVKTLTEYEPNFDARFAKDLLKNDEMSLARRQRGLEVLKRLDHGSRLTHILVQFLRDPDTRIQSKAAMMFGQITSARGVVERLLRDQDPRVRANLIEGLWKSTDTEGCRELFRQALKDPNHRVVGNALVGLYRLGEHRDFIAHLAKMAGRPEPLFRAAAAWALGQTGETRYTTALRRMVHDADPAVRRNALRALRRINLASSADAAPSEDRQGKQHA